MKNRPPSNAGSGKRLNAPKLMERSAATVRMTETPTFAETSWTKRPPTAMGHPTPAAASCRSAAFLGATSFRRIS